MVHLASDPHVMVGDLSSDVAGPPHPGHIPPGGNLLRRISESEPR